ncbi:hypothetical protein ACFY2R_06925 [Micromonospora olivasterospora]|uniref:Uncharacterized protein n=1 Tax=Micromonospora olivasterospora TaxID=1880 RepID=A0A562I645_MICOL|nr:hypothetical protein [Micromonospora olivasterospora]TWH66432.1 hypothetical protein JD77_01386 [Micromonospora olivasterospora]
MVGEAESGAVRELLMVVAVAGIGLLLALVAALAPWHPWPGRAAPASLVELHGPDEGQAAVTELTAG